MKTPKKVFDQTIKQKNSVSGCSFSMLVNPINSLTEISRKVYAFFHFLLSCLVLLKPIFHALWPLLLCHLFIHIKKLDQFIQLWLGSLQTVVTIVSWQLTYFALIKPGCYQFTWITCMYTYELELNQKVQLFFVHN